MIIQTSSNRLHFHILQWLLCSLMCYQTMRAHAILHIACRTFYGRSRQRGFLRRVLRWLLYTIRSNTIQSVSVWLCVCACVSCHVRFKGFIWENNRIRSKLFVFLFVIVDLSGWKESLLLKLFYMYLFISVYHCLSILPVQLQFYSSQWGAISVGAARMAGLQSCHTSWNAWYHQIAHPDRHKQPTPEILATPPSSQEFKRKEITRTKPCLIILIYIPKTHSWHSWFRFSYAGRSNVRKQLLAASIVK